MSYLRRYKRLIFSRQGAGVAYALVLFGVLLAISFSSFSYPPISDDWEKFHFFHHMDERPGPVKWLHILNHDPNERMRYQPLSRIFYYVFHVAFGSHFMFFQIFNFLFYLFCVIILYRFSLYFFRDRFMNAAFVGLFAFLFTHFDIVLWSSHIYIIAGFTMLLLGFIHYMKFLKTGGKARLPCVIVLFLAGILCYEPFFLWPAGIIILSCIKELRGISREKIIKANAVVLLIIFSAYFLFYLFVRSLGTYENPAYEIGDFLKLGSVIPTGFLVLFNTIYNNIAVNIIPFLAFPLNVKENIYMAGPVINYIDRMNEEVIFMGGATAGLLLVFFFVVFFFVCLYRKKGFEELKIIGFFLFLMLSQVWVIFFCRMIGGGLVYNLTEFRYQYIPNAFVILIVLVVFSRLLRPSRKARNILYIALSLLFILNVYCIRRVVNIYDFHFAKLQKMLTGIKTGIKTGEINNLDKLYIDKELPDYLPHLCWNIYMGEQFIPEGNYQWMFSRKEVEYFAESPENASWIINKKTFDVVENSPENRSIKGEKIVEIRDRWYLGLNKSQEYVHVGDFYIDEKRYKDAEEMFKKAIELNPRSRAAYSGLGLLYNSLKRHRESEGALMKAAEMKIRDPRVYDVLGGYYLEQERYKDAEEMFKKAIYLDPDHRDAHIGLKACYEN